MMNKKIEGAELIVYYLNGDNINIDLSAKQIEAICKILGLKMNDDGTYACYSDNGLKNLMEATIDKFERCE
jgi:hypothetical protein